MDQTLANARVAPHLHEPYPPMPQNHQYFAHSRGLDLFLPYHVTTSELESGAIPVWEIATPCLWQHWIIAAAARCSWLDIADGWDVDDRLRWSLSEDNKGQDPPWIVAEKNAAAWKKWGEEK